MTVERGDGIFVARDARNGRLHGERTVGGMVPLVLPGLPGQPSPPCSHLDRGGVPGGPRVSGVASFDLTEPRHDPRRYWRGPTWLNTTWLVAQGLRQPRYADLADGLDDDVVALTARSGLREYFHPLTGTGHGIDRFSWSAALLIDVLARRR